ncbi:MAG: hypothetical protein DI539_08495 [Flavobacterium psychrophilum]|nr:MAG: hypothetical protein DI539_08495 [Flavobacterium psychrophilum]
MRILLPILTLALLTLGCSNKDNSKESNKGTLQTNSAYTSQTNNKVLNENIHYIGFIDKFYFSSKNEAYVELYFINDHTTAEQYEKTLKLADSLIYQDDENSRYKFPDNLSQKYFDLRGLSKLKIYDKKNKFFCNAEFLRVEYLNQNISSPFIAVYKTDKLIKEDGYYGISNFNGTFEQINYKVYKDTLLTQNILKNLNEQRPSYGLENNGTHLSFSNNDTILSVINSENFTYITMTAGTDFKLLYKSPDFENVNDIKIIPLTKNRFPYILTRNVKPDTDVMWDNLLIFNGTKYTVTNRQRNE